MSSSGYDKDGQSGLLVDDVLRTLESSAVPQSLCDRVKEADADKDGILSVAEFVQLVLSEQQAVSQRRLFRRLLWALGIGSLLLIAALVGCVYGIVDLTRQVDDKDRVLSSRATGMPMATGQVVTMSSNLSSLVDRSTALEAALRLDRIVVPDEDGGFSVQKVSGVQVSSSGETVLSLASGDTMAVGMDGTISMTSSFRNGSLETGRDGPRRRLLSQEGGQQVYTVGGSQVFQPEKSPQKMGSRALFGPTCPKPQKVLVCYKCKGIDTELVTMSVCQDGMPALNGNCAVDCGFWTCGGCNPNTGFLDKYAPKKLDKLSARWQAVPLSVSESMNHPDWKQKVQECRALGDGVQYGIAINAHFDLSDDDLTHYCGDDE